MRYILTKNNKTLSFALIGIGLISIAYGFFTDHHGHRIWSSLLLGNYFILAIAIASLFFLSIQYVAEVGWSAQIKRVLQAYSQHIPYAGVFMLIIFLAGHHYIYHWTHHELVDKASPQFDAIIYGKSGFLNIPFFTVRLISYFLIWSIFAYLLRRESLLEDIDGDVRRHKRMIKYSAIFLVLYLVTSSTSAWDFIMSTDPHWFSTLFGWYTFASIFVTGLAAVTLLTIYLKRKGYLENINENHLHDLGKWMFAFSIFWTYLWFAQFMLIWYANIPEEIAYFILRFQHYKILFLVNVGINFAVPFLGLMTRDDKRKEGLLIFVSSMILIGHWIDMFLMIFPSTVQNHWTIGITEIGSTLFFAGILLMVTFRALSKAPVTPLKHPMLEESKHFHL